jgi:hypothetical protein
MHGAIENLLKLNLIEEIPSRPHRRRSRQNPLRDFCLLCDDEVFVFRSCFLFD